MATRKDGSTIVDNSGLSQGALRYVFTESIVSILAGGQYGFEQPYSVTNHTLAIGNFQHFQIDTVTGMTLVLTEIPRQKSTPDKINRLVFINSAFYLKYLIQNEQIQILGDTMVHCIRQFSPTYSKGNMDELFLTRFVPVTTNGVLIGNFTISPAGNVIDINVEPNDDFKAKEIEKFKGTLLMTNGLWTLPKERKPLYFRIDYVCRFMSTPQLSNIMFIFHTNDPHVFEKHGLTLQQKAEAEEHFKKGVQFLRKDKSEKAVMEFESCIRIDSLYLDAYYNMAYAHIKLNDKKSACEVWNRLKAMGQKQGEQMYLENCR